MQNSPSRLAWVNLLPILAGLLILKVNLSVVLGYLRYFPPDFTSDFLLGREAYFWGAYSVAFYVHIVSAPASLALGTLLVSQRFRRYAPLWHQRLGRVQVLGVLLLVAPSGLCMAYHATTGTVAAVGLGMLAVATAFCIAKGWRAAVDRRFNEHERWMWRTYVLLCSAVVIRLIGGLAETIHFEPFWLYPTSAWASWLGPLACFEACRIANGAAHHGRFRQMQLGNGPERREK